jgi:hypothetical protein
MERWKRASRALVLAAICAGCGDDGGEGDGSKSDGGSQGTGAADDAAASMSGDAARDASDGSTDAGSATKDDAGSGGAMLDADGFPSLPAMLTADTQGVIIVSVTNSTSAHLAPGIYESPFNVNATSGSSVTFLPAGLAVASGTSLQVQLQLRREQVDGAFECENGGELIVRYGAPPTGNTQLLPLSCSVEYSYDAAKDSYSGTLTASMGDGLTFPPSQTMKADLKARFTFVDKK